MFEPPAADGGVARLTPAPTTPIAEAVRPIAQEQDLAARIGPYAPWCWRADEAQAPILHLEDVSAIPFLSGIAGVEEYQHRARVRARTGDLYATVTASDPVYDAYCTDRLSLGRVTRLSARPGGAASRLAVAEGCLAGSAFDRLSQVARRIGRLLIHPYMSIEPVWELARQLAERTRAAVTVIGSPPPVTWIANDKALFDEVVTAVLGPEWTPDTRRADTVAGIAANLRGLAAGWPSIGLKRTRCASAMGNAVFDGAAIRAEPPAEVERLVRTFLTRTEWPPGETVLAVAWEQATASPSTQWWIPPADDGPPRLDGIYEQVLEGVRKVFVGSRPSTLPDRVNRTLASAARRVAEALQALGYVGRCSFDHIVLGDPDADFAIRFTECNGRWGGTSTPMYLVDRLITRARGARPPYRAQDVTMPGLVGACFGDLLDRAGDEAFDAERGTGRFLFYNVGPLRMFGKFDAISLGETQADADRAMLDALPALLGA